MNTKYGYYSSDQIKSIKFLIRKSIFFLLLYVDPQTKDEYPQIKISDAFRNLQYRLAGLNSILNEPVELVETMSLLESALIEYESECFEWTKYRKLILDAGAKIMQLKEGDEHGTDL